MPKLKAYVEDLEQVDEKHRDLYEKDEDGYVLNVEPVDGFALENVEGLKTTLQKVNKENRLLKGTVKRFDDLDPDKARKAIERLEELESNPPEDVEAKVKHQLEREREKLIKPLQEENEQLQTRVKSTSDALREARIRSAAIEAIDKHDGNPRLLMPHIDSKVDLREEDGQYQIVVLDEDGEPRTKADRQGHVHPMTVEDLVGELRESDDFAPAFNGSGASGGGTPSRPRPTRSPGGVRRLDRDADPRTLGENMEDIAAGKAQFSE